MRSNSTSNDSRTEFRSAWFADLLAEHEAPCVSIYQPLHRAAPHADENPLAFRRLVERMQESLRRQYDEKVVAQISQKVQSLADDPAFWVGDRNGMAVFASPDFVQVINLLEPVEPQVIVGESFHIKPLIRILQSADRFQILCVTMKRVDMFEAFHSRLERLELRNIPQDQMEVSGMRLGNKVDAAADLAQSARQNAQAEGQVEPVSVETFFRAVDKAVWENYSRPSGLPLILCADEKTNAGFRAVAKNPMLMEQSIMLDPRSLPNEQLLEAVKKIVEPIQQQRLTEVADLFQSAKAHQRGSDDVAQVAEAASVGRVGTLLVSANQHIPGQVLRDSGLIEQAPQGEEHADDVLDDLAEMVLRQDGQVLVLPPEAMPTETGVAAIYRY